MSGAIELLPAEQVHLALLEKWRVAMDLVGPGDARVHFDDAALAVTGLQAQGAWADLGSGAGFPGVALAARHPGAQVVLVESRERRVAFLRAVVADAGLGNLVVHHGRVEDLPASSLDGVIARAWRPPTEAWAEAQRLLRPGGRCVLLLATGQRVEAAPDTLVTDEPYAVDGKPRRRVILR